VIELTDIYRIEPDDFNLDPDSFDHQSKIHGIGHVYRVMFHCLKLGLTLELLDEARLAFFAAFIHDLSRKHDGRCTEHGKWAAAEKLILFETLFAKYGIDDTSKDHIRAAIINHSLPGELPKDHPSWTVTAILKDADALDRIRLGENDLDPRYLRFSETINRIWLARELYYATSGKSITRFSEIISVGNMVDSVPRV
jgi:hypothetical protein